MQAGTFRCCSSRWRNVSPAVSLRTGTFGGGSAGGSATILRATHAPRLTGFDSRPSESPARMAAWLRTPPRSGRPWRNHDEAEAALRLVGEVVVVGDGFIGEDEVRGNQICRREVVPDKVLDELDGLLLQSFARVASEFREALAVRLEDLELVEAQPLGDELGYKSGEARVSDHTIDFRVELLGEQAAGGELPRAGVRRTVPQKVGEFRGEFPIIQGLGLRARAGFDEEEELWGREDHLQGVLDRFLEAAPALLRFRVYGQKGLFFGGGDGPAKGSRCEVCDYAVSRRFGRPHLAFA